MPTSLRPGITTHNLHALREKDTSMRKTLTTTHGRIAIRVNKDTLLAVPPMHPHTPSAVRVQIFELVLRRQPGLAQTVAETWADSRAGVDGARDRLAHLLAETPYRGSAMAA